MTNNINTITLVDLPPGYKESLPLVCSMVFGERDVSVALNQLSLGDKSSGINTGFLVSSVSGTMIRIHGEGEFPSTAMVRYNDQLIKVIQQHDVLLPLVTGNIWYIVLEAFNETGVVTKQASYSSELDAASIKAVSEDDIRDNHVLLATVDMSHGLPLIKDSDITLSNRDNGGSDDSSVKSHNNDVDAHESIRDSVTESILGSTSGNISIVDGLITSLSEIINGNERFTTFIYNDNGDIKSSVTTYMGKRRSRVYVYGGDGELVSYTTT